MRHSPRSRLWLPFITTVMLLCLTGNTKDVLAQEQERPNDNAPSIQVMATGQAEVQPDVAVVRIGVETQAEAASDAIAQNNQQMQSLMDALVQAGVPQDQIQTQVIQLQPVYQSSAEGQPQPNQPPIPNEIPDEDELVGYRAINVVQLRTQEIDQLGVLLDTAVQAGGNRIEGIRFTVNDPARWLDQAREEAWSEAQRRAEQLAQLAGAELGRVLTITESGSNVPVFAETAQDAAAAAVPVAPGTQTIQATLQITWQLRYSDEE